MAEAQKAIEAAAEMTQRPQNDAERFSSLMRQRQQLQQNALKSTREQLVRAMQMPVMDFSPVAGFVDQLTGSNMAASTQPILTAAQKEALVQGYQKMMNDASEQMFANEIQTSLKKASTPLGDLTPGQKKIDEEFGKAYADFYAQGGYADAEKGLRQLKEVEDLLLNESGITGPTVGFVPKSVRSLTNRASVGAQEAVEEVVQRNLRLILGAQFTEREGTRLIERAYNPTLSQAENAKRISRLTEQMKSALLAKEQAGEYFEEYGTLKGYKGTLFTSANDFLNDKEDSDAYAEAREWLNDPRNATDPRRQAVYDKLASLGAL